MWKTDSFVKKKNKNKTILHVMQPTRNVQYCVIHEIVPNREVSVEVDHVFILPVKCHLNPKCDKTTKGKKMHFL